MYLLIKRLLDIVMAVIALVILSPLFILVMIGLRFTGEGEIFYQQQRVGFHNKIFGIWKFATMLKNSPNIGTGVITLRNDPRVTNLGRLLRMTKLNELPQLLNVIKGEMSFIGPRPLMKVSFDKYTTEVQTNIYQLRPGITGVGSIIFRDEEKIVTESEDREEAYRIIFQHKGNLEMWYKKHIGFYTDIMILFLTVWILVFPKSKLMYKVFADLPARNF